MYSDEPVDEQTFVRLCYQQDLCSFPCTLETNQVQVKVEYKIQIISSKQLLLTWLDYYTK